jgi:hypothetical protein
VNGDALQPLVLLRELRLLLLLLMVMRVVMVAEGAFLVARKLRHAAAVTPSLSVVGAADM